ncbi:NAD(P)/FAD-dependent oxidoreductase [Amycolatopsis circi]|uniref:NAD(P)/FAD-dependent oxidoreductase n=1 Tax=Amycolatopsis circi TaxID=871959 RepID=UPI000E283A50|nr:NAD(P)/FAD-dependent oxidoreductase [Amycolatopsis circi]
MDSTTRPSAESLTETVWDSIIVGGGSAGLSAGIVLARAQFATLVVDGGAPRNGPADHMHGYLTRDGMAPKEFVATGQEEFTRYGGTLARGTVTDVRRAEDGMFELRLDYRSCLRARSILVATGLTDELPEVPGLAAGWASLVHHCPHCHGYEVRGSAIAVVGSEIAPHSAHLAALMRRYSPSVTFCVNGAKVDAAERQRLGAYGVRLIDAPVSRVVASDGDEAPVTIELADGTTVPCDAIFVGTRPEPHDALLTALGAERDPVSGLVPVDAAGATAVDGVWAAGNVVNPRAQVVSAAGAGSAAGIAMTGWLLDRELSAAVSRQGGNR